MDDDIRTEYRRRLEVRRNSQKQLNQRHTNLGNGRLVLAILAIYLGVKAFAYHALSPIWILFPVFVFLLLAIIHEYVIRALSRSSRAIAFYARGLARLENRWIGTGETGDRFLDSSHPYSTDLDLFGQGSLFQLLSTARTPMGEDTLAEWLTRAAPVRVVRQRQQLVSELRPKLDLREDLAVIAESLRSRIHPKALSSWGEGKLLLKGHWVRIIALVLGCLGILSLVAWATWGTRSFFVIMVVVNVSFSLWFRKRIQVAVDAAEAAVHDLVLLSEVLARFECENFQTPGLNELQSSLKTHGWPPSRRIARLNRLIVLLDSRKNLFIKVVDPLVFWTLQLAFLVEAWRKESGSAIRGWLSAVGELEALLALSNYSFEHPGNALPEIVEEGPCFIGEGIAHPLIPEGRAVRNDLQLDRQIQIMVVSGSNMSGKSTLLRTVGIDTALALAGASVPAQRLRLSPLAIGASIHVQDSLQSGVSRFYAEITRLRRILDLTLEPLPVLFLVDEFLQGTNSHDRRIGAEAIVRSLVKRGAIGLVTTHDLALTQIAEELSPLARNVHFEDQLIEGQLHFDYKLRPGIVQKSNALELMRSVGIDV
ncbi:MAG TPA: DNA mismatch repair protein MutS [Terriglobia bacterium]|nr:DNA mismatch repair protein MutS [Terriglobia bacterium]